MITQTLRLTEDRLQFSSGTECSRWVQSLPLTNVLAAQAALTKQIVLTRNAGLPPLELLKVLETLREPVDYVQNELARKYAGKALPLDATEKDTWDKVVGLWNEFGDAYLACRNAHIEGDPGLRDFGPLIVMRCLRCRAHAMFEHYRVYRQVSAASWQALHQLYAHAEANGYAQAGVSDVFGGTDAQSSCVAAYCHALLAQLANPFALSGRQMEFLARWLDKWSGLASLAPQMPPPSTKPLPTVDLGSSCGARFAEEGLQPSPTLRYLDLETLSRTLRQVIALLKQGQSPAQLGLGDDARQPGCESLLMLLYIQWCRLGTSDESRSQTEEMVQVCLGMHAAHFYISGRAFRAPGSDITRREEQDMQLFGHISERTQRMLASQQSSAIESWRLLNQSASGFLSMLRELDAGVRIGHNKFVAVRRGASKLFHLGIVQWLRIEESGELLVGTRLFPGIARAIAVKPANPVGNSGFERAFLLPEVPTPATAATLILPPGWYKAGRLLELHADGKQIAQLVNLLEKGCDFDRCTFSFA